MKIFTRLGLMLALAVGLQAQSSDAEALESQVVGVEMARGDGTFLDWRSKVVRWRCDFMMKINSWSIRPSRGPRHGGIHETNLAGNALS